MLDEQEGATGGFQASPGPQPSGELQLEELLRRGGADGGGGLVVSLADGGLPESQLLALAQRQAERDRELAAAHRRVQNAGRFWESARLSGQRCLQQQDVPCLTSHVISTPDVLSHTSILPHPK